MNKFSRRSLLLGAGAVAGGITTRALLPALPVLDGTTSLQPATGPSTGRLNDASGLSETPVSQHIIVQSDPSEQRIIGLQNLLMKARSSGRSFNTSSARHSMGAHAIARDGINLSLHNDFVEPDTASQIYRVNAGASWQQVITALDPLAFGPKVMQSNNDFGVAATFSVNAHGWPFAEGPMGSTVRAFRMIMASGELIECSRSKNSELFKLAMGGYGLFGIIVDLDVEMAANQNLAPSYDLMDGADFAQHMVAALADPSIDLAYGRLNIDRESFFDHGLLISFRPTDDQSELPAATGSGTISHLSRHVLRRQLGNEAFKHLRWSIESKVQPHLGDGVATRNTLLNEPVATLEDRDPSITDILHEYFVPPEQFPAFVDLCKQVIPGSYQELLNITLRYVASDKDSVLRYASGPRIAAVMLFSQEMSSRAEADMQRMTRALIDGVHAIGGSYYLPYRPHATQDQFQTSYPAAAAFAEAKRQHDPGLIFSNGFWINYLENI